MKTTIAVVMSIAAIQLSAGVCKWTGNAGDGKWSSVGNWSSVPSTTDEVEFDPGNTSIAVTLDQAGLTTVSIVRVKSGMVTLNAASGASLRTTGTNMSGIDVAAGAELVMVAPLDLNARFNKTGSGAVRFQSSLTSTGGSVTSYFFDGKVILEGDANLSFDGLLGLGLGSRDAHASVILKDNARLRVGHTIATGHNDNKSASGEIVVDGANAELIAWRLYLGSNTAPVDPSIVHGMIVSNGTVNLTTFLLGNTSSASFVQEGGTVSASTFTVKDDATLSASFALRGGTFTYDNASAEIPDYQYAEFVLHGGTFAATKGLTVDKALDLAGNVAFDVPANKIIVFAKSPTLAAETVFSKKGEGKLSVKKDVVARGALSIEAGEMCFDAGVTVSNPDGVYTPYPVSVAADSTLRLEAVTTRFSLPLSLTLNGTVAMSDGDNGYVCRSVLVSHKRTGKGRFAPSAANHLTGGAGSSIVVPWVWTGGAGDNSWSNKDNWDNGIVPESRSSTIVDISAATAPVVLDADINLGGIVSMPGVGRVRAITGSGSIKFVVNSSYQCCSYIQEGSELVIDVGLDKEKANYLTILGGGKFTAKKGYPTLNGNVPPFALDATVSLDGDFGSTADMYLGAFSHCREGCGNVIIDSGANVKFKNLFVSADVSGEYPIKSFRQVAGAVTGDQIYITLFASESRTPDPFAYILDGGTMTMWAVKLGAQYTTAYPNIFPGGSFIMNGGTATINGLTSYQNQNYFKLNGGDLYCRTFAVATLGQSLVGIGNIDQNVVSYELGAVTLHPKDANGLTVSANATLTGVGGDTCVSCDNGYTVTFAAGTCLDGVSGIVKSGSGTLYFKGETEFAGALTVNNGSVVFDTSSVLNGISRFVVTNSMSSIMVNGSILKSPEMIELVSASCLSVASGNTMTVRRLIVGGVEYGEGSYSFGSGTVVVARVGDGLWLGGNGASWGDGDNWASGSAPSVGASVDFGSSVLESAATIIIDEPVSLSSLSYAHPGLDGSLTLAGTVPLSIANGGLIYVEEGDALVLSVPLAVGDVLRKTGGGKLVLSGGLSSAGDGIVYALDGEIQVACAVSGVKIAVTGHGATPMVSIGDGACLSGELVVLDTSSCSQSAVVKLEEGTITGSTSGEFARAPIVLSLDGTTVFRQSDAAVCMEIATAVTGNGTIAQQGTGVLKISGGIGSANLALLGGVLVIGADAAASMDGRGLFYDAKEAGSSLALDFAGIAQVKNLRIRNRGKPDGFYDEGLNAVSELDPLKGYLQVLESSAEGFYIIIK